jgi:hypothetical protein
MAVMSGIDWNPTSAWSAKIEHAKRHTRALGEIVADYRATDPIRLEPEPIGDEIGYRLRISHPVPIEVSLVIGDVLHNVRSALDALVFGLARDQAQRPLTDKEERACEFPVCDSPAAYQRFWSGRRQVIAKDRLTQALHRAQPFFDMVEGERLGIEYSETYEQWSRGKTLWWLAHLNNVDKHRQLAITAWWPGLTYWGSDEGQTPQHWRYGSRRFADGEIFGYASGGGDSGPNEVTTEFNLVLTQLPYRGNQDVVATSNEWIGTTAWTMNDLILDWSRSADD